jgi:hypothetical protein
MKTGPVDRKKIHFGGLEKRDEEDKDNAKIAVLVLVLR